MIRHDYCGHNFKFACSVHPKYKGVRPPTSNRWGCYCEEIYRFLVGIRLGYIKIKNVD